MNYKEMHSFHTCTIVLNILVFKTSHKKRGLLIQAEIALKMGIISAYLKGILNMRVI